jgi:hypothetical protein
MQSPTPLNDGSRIRFERKVHLEIFRGGENRLLLRSYQTAAHPTRLEILFAYVQHLNIPTCFDGLVVQHDTNERAVKNYELLLRQYPKCRLYRLDSNDGKIGEIVASACLYGEDTAPLGSESMFPFMTSSFQK